jgi:hypothetical protein
MSFLMTGLPPTRTSRGFSIHCRNKGKDIAVFMPFLIIDQLDCSAGSYLDRLNHHSDEILKAAQRSFDAGKMEFGMIRVTSDDFYDSAVSN